MPMPSLLQIEAECRSGVLAKRIGPLSADTIGYALQRQSPGPVFTLGCGVARRLQRNGVLRSDWSRGRMVAAVDGIEIRSSFARCCDACMQREVQVLCALALLQDLVGPLGRRFLDLLVGDALYLQAPFVRAVERLGLDWAFTLKENQPELLREAERFTSGPPAAVRSESDRELRWGHLPQVDWPVADRLV